MALEHGFALTRENWCSLNRGFEQKQRRIQALVEERGDGEELAEIPRYRSGEDDDGNPILPRKKAKVISIKPRMVDAVAPLSGVRPLTRCHRVKAFAGHYDCDSAPGILFRASKRHATSGTGQMQGQSGNRTRRRLISVGSPNSTKILAPIVQAVDALVVRRAQPSRKQKRPGQISLAPGVVLRRIRESYPRDCWRDYSNDSFAACG